jgi:hypothetical protein
MLQSGHMVAADVTALVAVPLAATQKIARKCGGCVALGSHVPTCQQSCGLGAAQAGSAPCRVWQGNEGMCAVSLHGIAAFCPACLGPVCCPPTQQRLPHCEVHLYCTVQPGQMVAPCHSVASGWCCW